MSDIEETPEEVRKINIEVSKFETRNPKVKCGGLLIMPETEEYQEESEDMSLESVVQTLEEVLAALKVTLSRQTKIIKPPGV